VASPRPMCIHILADLIFEAINVQASDNVIQTKVLVNVECRYSRQTILSRPRPCNIRN
jgi:hypothetical protein